MFGLFKVKCPHCGGELEPTGYSAPYPSHRCKSCIRRNTDRQKLSDLEKRIAELEATND